MLLGNHDPPGDFIALAGGGGGALPGAFSVDPPVGPGSSPGKSGARRNPGPRAKPGGAPEGSIPRLRRVFGSSDVSSTTAPWQRKCDAQSDLGDQEAIATSLPIPAPRDPRRSGCRVGGWQDDRRANRATRPRGAHKPRTERRRVGMSCASSRDRG